MDAASEFARWLRFSGILKLLEGAPDHPILRCKGAELARKTSDLAHACGSHYKEDGGNGVRPAQIPQSRLASIDSQLAEMAKVLATLKKESARS